MNATYACTDYTFDGRTLTIKGKPVTAYAVKVEGPQCVRLTKLSGDRKSYLVDLRPTNPNPCNCYGFQSHRHCKHVDCVSDLMEAGAFGDEFIPQPTAPETAVVQSRVEPLITIGTGPSLDEIRAASDECHDQLDTYTGWTPEMAEEHADDLRREAVAEVASNPLALQLHRELVDRRKQGCYWTWVGIDNFVHCFRYLNRKVAEDAICEALDLLHTAEMIDYADSVRKYTVRMVSARLEASGRKADESWMDSPSTRTEAEFWAKEEADAEAERKQHAECPWECGGVRPCPICPAF